MDNPFAAYPLYLTAKDIQDILQVSKATAYNIMNLNDFPLIQVGGSNAHDSRTGLCKRSVDEDIH